MALEDLSLLEIIQGATNLIYAIFGTIIGLMIVSKYITYKRQELLWIGLSLALVAVPWYGGGISFLTFVFFDYILPDPLYFFLSYGFLAIALTIWMNGLSLLLYPNSRKKIVLITSLICISYEILFIVLLFTNLSMVGEKVGKFNSDAALIPTIFIIFALLIIIITMMLFIRQCLKSEVLKIKWKGRFLSIAVILLVTGSIIDGIITPTPMIVIIARIILMVSVVFSYLGWFLPDRVANWLIKNKE